MSLVRQASADIHPISVCWAMPGAASPNFLPGRTASRLNGRWWTAFWTMSRRCIPCPSREPGAGGSLPAHRQARAVAQPPHAGSQAMTDKHELVFLFDVDDAEQRPRGAGTAPTSSAATWPGPGPVFPDFRGSSPGVRLCRLPGSPERYRLEDLHDPRVLRMSCCGWWTTPLPSAPSTRGRWTPSSTGASGCR